MTAHSLLFTMAAIGISISSYLVRERMRKVPVTCPIGGDCKAVLSSKYNHMFGFHNDILGLLFYIAASLVTAFLVLDITPLTVGSYTFSWILIIKIMVGGAAIMSLALIYIQWRIIKKWCFWCIMSAATIAGMELIFLTSNLII